MPSQLGAKLCASPVAKLNRNHMQPQRDPSSSRALLTIFQDSTTSPRAKVLWRIGYIIAAFGPVAFLVIKHIFHKDNLALAVWGISYIIPIFLSIGFGLQQFAQQRHSNVFAACLVILWRVFLYIFLPSIILVGILLIIFWHQFTHGGN